MRQRAEVPRDGPEDLALGRVEPRSGLGVPVRLRREGEELVPIPRDEVGRSG
jgi:hypothetical protein